MRTSLLQPEFGFYARALEGSGASRLYGPGDGATRTAHGQPVGSSLPPALEAPSPTAHAEASEPGPSGPKGPILDTYRNNSIGPRGQRLFPGSPGQVAFDGTTVDPPPQASQDAQDAPQGAHDHRQAPLPLPEPWHDQQQLRLDVAYVPPAGPWVGTLRQFQTALSLTWSSLAAWLRAHHYDPRDVAFAERRAREVPDCGTSYMTPRCACGHESERHAVVVDGCESRACPICGKRRASHYRRAGFVYVDAHPIARKKGQVSRGYFLSTTTEPKPDVLTVDGIRASVKRVKKSSSNKWRCVGKFNPRDKDGRYGKYPGKCSDAGMLARVECGPHGNVHAHELRFGAYHYSEDLRRAAGGVWTKDKQVKTGTRGIRGAVVEVLKYEMKSSTKPGRREFTHPALAVLYEFAVKGQRLVEGYGTMRGLVRQADEAALEERQGVVRDMGERLREIGACPCCGRVDAWRWEHVTRPPGWVPRAGAPPGG